MKNLGFGVIAVAVGLCAQVGFAHAPERSARPLLRPGTPVVAAPALPKYNIPVYYHADIRPILRPGTYVAPVPAPVSVPVSPAPDNLARASNSSSPQAVYRSQRPRLRPAGLSTVRRASVAPSAPASTPAAPAPAPVTRTTGKFGAICGSRAIRGQKVASIPGKLPGCGLRKAVKISEVSGVRLSTPSIMDCDTAKALDRWVRKGVVPAVGRLGGGPAELKVVAHYSCRTRNNKPGGKISEHGKGKAVDIAGLTLKNGAKISVLKGWNDPVQGKVLKAMHASACGPFGTVLGPNADRYHKDHLHLDTARHRGGSYCR